MEIREPLEVIKRFYFKITILLLMFNLICLTSFAHSGGTDRQGGHKDHYTGEYHFHHGHGPHQHPDGICVLPTQQNMNNNYNKNINPTNYITDQDAYSYSYSPNNSVWAVGILGLGAGLLIKGTRKK